MVLFPKRYVGRSFAGYTIKKVLGQGRYGICFTAKGPGGATVTLKRFHNRTKKKNEDKNSFEPVILSRLEHKAIPSLLGVINHKRDYFFVLEYMPGVSIEKLIFHEHHTFSESEFYNIGIQLIDILCFLHRDGIVHRDVRISNVLYDNGTISLVDFGLARFCNNDDYRLESDFSYLGDFLLYILYAMGQPFKDSLKGIPWYEELPLPPIQIAFLKRLLGITLPYQTIDEIKEAFCSAFQQFKPHP